MQPCGQRRRRRTPACVGEIGLRRAARALQTANGPTRDQCEPCNRQPRATARAAAGSSVSSRECRPLERLTRRVRHRARPQHHTSFSRRTTDRGGGRQLPRVPARRRSCPGVWLCHGRRQCVGALHRRISTASLSGRDRHCGRRGPRDGRLALWRSLRAHRARGSPPFAARVLPRPQLAVHMAPRRAGPTPRGCRQNRQVDGTVRRERRRPGVTGKRSARPGSSSAHAIPARVVRGRARGPRPR